MKMVMGEMTPQRQRSERSSVLQQQQQQSSVPPRCPRTTIAIRSVSPDRVRDQASRFLLKAHPKASAPGSG